MIQVHIIGGGLAGSEAAWQLSKRQIPVILYEMRGNKKTAAHVTDHLAELVCSNSFRSDDINSAVGLLHAEMRSLDSIIMRCADANRVPAGSALAVDRVQFSKDVEMHLKASRYIEIKRQEITEIPNCSHVIIATGPLTSDALSKSIMQITGENYLAFFDAISPIIHHDSIDFSIAWMQSRYDKGEGKDYVNCPLLRDEYYQFIEALLCAEKTEYKQWEKDTPYFNGCLPIEVMAERGKDTLRFGPMKPVGLTNPHLESKPYAVVQLRLDNKLGTLYNMVGFQTKLKYSVQKEIFRKIPGLNNAEFARLGGLHRNTFINSLKLLDSQLRLKTMQNVRFAGQITGVEGYLESAAIGLLAGLFTAFEIKNEKITIPQTTAIGSLLQHITNNAQASTFQPMNINYGLFPELMNSNKNIDKKALYRERAVQDLKITLSQIDNL